MLVKLARAVAVVALVAAAASCRPERSAPLPTASEPLSLLALPTLAGGTFDPASLAGKVVVVNFWSPG